MITVLFYDASFSFSYLLTYLIPAVIALISNPFAKLIIPIRIPTKEAKAETEKKTVIAEP